MLPPVNNAAIERNPKFRMLYSDLVKSRLNPDGSTKKIKLQRDQAEIEKVSFFSYQLRLVLFFHDERKLRVLYEYRCI